MYLHTRCRSTGIRLGRPRRLSNENAIDDSVTHTAAVVQASTTATATTRSSIDRMPIAPVVAMIPLQPIADWGAEVEQVLGTAAASTAGASTIAPIATHSNNSSSAGVVAPTATTTTTARPSVKRIVLGVRNPHNTAQHGRAVSYR